MVFDPRLQGITATAKIKNILFCPVTKVKELSFIRFINFGDRAENKMSEIFTVYLLGSFLWKGKFFTYHNSVLNFTV